ncbi:hypothetical protein [Acinetobacter johnsonii]|uniref:hypothetical protein n=1 Tax=Acinetobacter johnsonii TaxID=40214 RepID=UPI0002624800|nr:hypothetical protein [Acinetobacter johnsonii]
MNIINYLDEQFSKPNLKHLEISFHHTNELGHDGQALHSKKYNKTLDVSGFCSKYIDISDNELSDILSKSEPLKFDNILGCLVGKNILEFKLQEIAKNYNDSSFLSLLGLSFNGFKEITFQGDKYSIKLTNKTINHWLGILNIKEYSNYLDKILDGTNPYENIFCQSKSLYFQVINNDQTSELFHQFSTHDSKKKLIKELNSCLLTLASQGHCLNLIDNYFKVIKNHSPSHTSIDNQILSIPLYSFEDEAMAFYKLAKSSTYPSQKFLHYYHVMEFFFLKTSESELHKIIEAKVANPSYLHKDNAISEIINSVKKFDLRSDEEEKLRLVLKSSTENEALLHFIANSQNHLKEKYSKSKKIFGKDISIRFEHDHIIGNIAKVIKHLRNALVHSSDLYNREECYVPFSSCEDIYAEFTELMDYLALDVLSSNAKKI